MLTHRPLYDPLAQRYTRWYRRRRAWRKAGAWIIFVAGALFYGFGLWAFLACIP